MMGTSYYKLDIENREFVGKKAAKHVRRAGKIPSVLYFKGEKPVSVSIEKQLLYQAIKSDQRIYEVEIENETEKAFNYAKKSPKPKFHEYLKYNA